MCKVHLCKECFYHNWDHEEKCRVADAIGRLIG